MTGGGTIGGTSTSGGTGTPKVGEDNLEDLKALVLLPHEQQELLDTATECTFIFAGPTGWPGGVIMSFLYANEKFWLTAVAGRRQVKAIENDDRASIVVSSAGTGLARQMLAVRGRAVVRTDAATKEFFFPRFAARLAPADRAAFIALLDSENRVIFEFVPVAPPLSHDSRKIPGDGRGGRR